MSMAPLLGLPGKITTLLTRLTSTRAANLDNLDAAVTTRAASATALSSATWTSGRAALIDNLDAPISGIPTSIIASIQRGQTQISTTTQNITITSVDLNKSTLNILGYDEGGGDYWLYAYLSSATNIVVSCESTNVGIFSWEVIEYV